MVALPQIQARSLDELAGLIEEAFENAERNSMRYYTTVGELLTEAKMEHFSTNNKGFWEWAERRFGRQKTQLTRYMDLYSEIKVLPDTRARDSAQPFESIGDFERSRGVKPSGERSPKRDYHDPIEKILNKVNPYLLQEEAKKRNEELDQIRKLADQIIDIGYKALATKLHPDKKGGSRNAMTLLNSARERLRRHR